MRGARTDLVLVGALAVAAAVLVAALPDDPVGPRAAAALALVLALPGYALTSALFPPVALRPAERVLLTLALSLVATILGGLLLHVVGASLEASTWAAVLGATTVAAAAAGQRLGHARPLRGGTLGLRGGEVAALSVAFLLLVAAGTLGGTPLPAPDRTRGSTALWLVPRAADRVELGVRSGQLEPATYLLDVSVAGRPTRRLGPLRLEPGETWTRTLSTGTGAPRVSAVLRRASAPRAAYRRAVLRRARNR